MGEVVPFQRLSRYSDTELRRDVELLEANLVGKLRADDAREWAGGLLTFTGPQTGNFVARPWDIVDMRVLAAGVVVGLPDARLATVAGTEILVVNHPNSLATVTVACVASGVTIDNSAVAYCAPDERLRLKSDGEQWRRIG
jgi:hypothetical protein